MSTNAAVRPLWLAIALCALGAVARVVACFFDPPLHPDEFFQYLEPAYTHLTGVGIEAWEYRDGLRSWVLPFYNGAWLAAFMKVGVPEGPLLVRLLQLQWAVVNAWLVWLAYRGGASAARRLGATSSPRASTRNQAAGAGWEGGALAAFLCATFPLLVFYAGHTLSELPAMLFLVAGLVELSELTEEAVPETPRSVRKAALAGALLSFGACLRIANGPLVLIAPIWLLVTRRYRALGALVLAALPPALVFALVDLATWGSFAHSFVAYVKFNFIEGKAANFGIAAPSYYVEFCWKRAPYLSPLLVLIALLGLRGNFGFLLPALGAVGYLSTQPHKEERFVVLVWPLLFIAAGAVLGALWSRARNVEARGSAREQNVEARGSAREQNRLARGFTRLLRGPLPMLVVLATLADSVPHAGERTWLLEGRFLAQKVIAKDPTLTGLLMDGPIFGGGAAWIGSRAPHLDFGPGILPNPLITHVLAGHPVQVLEAEAHGFKRIAEVDGLVILRRLPAQDQR